jgi:hypothetical protein
VNAGRWHPYRHFAPAVSATPLAARVNVAHLPLRAEGRPRCTLRAYWTSTSPGPQRPPATINPRVPLAARGRIGACAVSRTAHSGLARSLSLNRWARHRAIRAEHAAIALLWTQRRASADTFVEELAGINRHGFRFGGSAMRAGDNAFKDHGAYLCTSPRYITICPSTVGSGHLRR